MNISRIPWNWPSPNTDFQQMVEEMQAQDISLTNKVHVSL
jgi:hypothetical protein